MTTDLTRMDQALSHIMDNAIRHSPAGERVLIAIDQGPANGVRVVIRDNGLGIEAADQERIWQPFEQAGQTNDGSWPGPDHDPPLDGTPQGRHPPQQPCQQRHLREPCHSILG